MKPYEGQLINGPYLRSNGRYCISHKYPGGKKHGTSYARYIKIGRAHV